MNVNTKVLYEVRDKNTAIEKIAAALKELGSDIGFTPDNAADYSLEYFESPSEATGGAFDDASKDTRAWKLSWTKRSWSQQRDMRFSKTLVEQTEGGLYAGSGGEVVYRMWVLDSRNADKTDIEATLRLIQKGVYAKPDYMWE